MQGARPANAAELGRQRTVVDAFLAALRDGDFEALLAVLDPDLVVRFEAREVRGAAEWARGAIAFARMARVAQPALVNGAVGVVAAPRGRLFRVLRFSFTGGKIGRVEVIGDPAQLRELDLAVLPG